MVMIGFSAAVMAYLIAWILSSYSQHYNVPVKLLNTMQPNAAGTTITAISTTKGVKAVAA